MLRLLEAVLSLGLKDKTRIYQASTSELYGSVSTKAAQNEHTPFNPVSPYAAAKLYAFYIAESYKKGYGLHVSNGILFNHESPRRGENFVSRKITYSIAQILAGDKERLVLGNIDAKRDWGHARDYVKAMWQILQQTSPDNYVISTGETHTVREFVEVAFKLCGIGIRWSGLGADEKGYDDKDGRVLVSIDSKYYRPVEVPYLLGDSSKAKQVLGWTPTISFKELVNEMLQADLLSFNIKLEN